MNRWIILLLICISSFTEMLWADDVHDFLEKVKTHLDSKTDQANIKMTITEPSGEKKVREMSLKVLRTPKGFKALARMSSPADMKGTAVLTIVEDGTDQEWLYIPTNKQVRRIASSKSSTGVLGSELRMEDLDPTAMKEAKTTLSQKDPQSPVLEVTPSANTSEYSKVLTTFSLPNYLPVKSEYYKNSKLEKTVEFSDYKTFYGNIYRAQKVKIQNVVKNRGTDLDFTDIKVNVPLAASQFTPTALKESW